MTRARRAGWLLVLVGAVLLLVWGIGLYLTGRSLAEHLSQAQALADAPEAVDVAALCTLVKGLREDVTALQREAGLLLRLGPALGWLPGVGGDLKAAPYLLEIGAGLSEAGERACDVLEPAFAPPDEVRPDALSLAEVGELLAEHRHELGLALAAVERVQAAWARIDAEDLSPRLSELLAPLTPGLPLLRAGLAVAAEAPDLLGMGGPRNYLILAQNEDELRPTGGFISSAGLLTVDGGQIAGLSFVDAYSVDDYLHKPYPDPPEPLFAYMGSEIWLFRDANWSPDFPTSARQVAYFYEYGQGVEVDAVIAIDQHAVELLMAGLGEIPVPGSSEPVTAANVRGFMREAWGPDEGGSTSEWIFSRKEFIGRLAAAIRERVEGGPDGVDWMQVLRSLHQALTTRHLLVSFENPTVARELVRLGWDGALRESPGDYLMAVDANLGFNKADPLISRTLDYRVELHPDGTGSADLSLAYTHRGTREDISCQQGMPYRRDLTYEKMIHNCYYDYLRLYVPSGSLLRESTAYPTPGQYLVRHRAVDGRVVALEGEGGKAVFAQFFVLEYGKALTAHFRYDLPQILRSDDGHQRYTLLIQKQPGTRAIPVTVTVVLPPGRQLLHAAPEPTATDERTLQFDLRLETDLTVEVLYDEQ